MHLLRPLAGRLALVIAFLLLRITSAQQNITVDDNDPAIVYSPIDSWEPSSPDEMDAGGSHMVTVDPIAQATLQFTGVAVYYMSPKWADRVNTAISLDGGPPDLVDLRDHLFAPEKDGPATISSAVVWQATDLENTEHTLIMSVGSGQRFAVVDMLIYTVQDEGGVTSSISSTTTSPATSTSTLTSSSSETSQATTMSASTKTGLSIAIGTVCTIFGLLVIGSVLWIYRRRRRRRREQELLASIYHNGDTDMSETNETFPSEPSYRSRYRSKPTAHMPPPVNNPVVVPPPYAFSGGRGGRAKPKPPVPSRASKPASKLRNVVAAAHDPTRLTSIPEASGFNSAK